MRPSQLVTGMLTYNYPFNGLLLIAWAATGSGECLGIIIKEATGVIIKFVHEATIATEIEFRSFGAREDPAGKRNETKQRTRRA